MRGGRYGVDAAAQIPGGKRRGCTRSAHSFCCCPPWSKVSGVTAGPHEPVSVCLPSFGSPLRQPLSVDLRASPSTAALLAHPRGLALTI